MRSRKTNPSLFLIRLTLSGVRRTVSVTASMGMPKICPPAETTMMRDIAMFMGRSSRTVVPAPTRLMTEARPPIRSTVARTTSMPTPRPEISETSAAVENPAEKIRSMT
jgi:hypothetical protein